MAIKAKEFSLNLPFGIGGCSFEISEGQKNVAWALYAELATRVSTQKLNYGEGSAREALNSVHSLFESTRSVLRAQGPDVGRGKQSVGRAAIRILNEGIRPFLVTWHTALSGFESDEKLRLAKGFGGNHNLAPDEGKWTSRRAFYTALEAWRKDMQKYLKVLEKFAGMKA